MKIYIVLHSNPALTGFFSGIDFYGGRGTTSCRTDAVKAVRCGCRLEDPADDALARRELGLRAEDEAATRAARAAENEAFGQVVAAEHVRKRG